MKTPLFAALLFFALTLGSCSTGETGDGVVNKDSLAKDSIAQLYTLENLLRLEKESDLVSRFGKQSVIYDTIWGAEGFFTMGTIIKTEEGSHIEVTWANEEQKRNIVSVTLVSDQDWYADSISHGQWHSRTGVELGMPIEKLQSINGRPFTFSGFGWDYAGHVISWREGNLDGKGIAVQLSEGPAAIDMNQLESAQVLGDVEVESNNPLLKPFRPRVWSISVAKVQ